MKPPKTNEQAELPCFAERTNITGAWKPPELRVNTTHWRGSNRRGAWKPPELRVKKIQQAELPCSAERTDGEQYPAVRASMLWRRQEGGVEASCAESEYNPLAGDDQRGAWKPPSAVF